MVGHARRSWRRREFVIEIVVAQEIGAAWGHEGKKSKGRRRGEGGMTMMINIYHDDQYELFSSSSLNVSLDEGV